MRLFPVLQFLHPVFNKIRGADAVDLIKKTGEVPAGSNAAFFGQGLDVIKKVFPVPEKQGRM